jgi:hypothetical protein
MNEGATTMKTLFEKQTEFSVLVARLILQAVDMGYQVKIGEVLRPKEMAQIYAARGIGVKNSLHIIQLAIDLQLFLGGEFLTHSEDYEPLGLWWEKQSTDDFKCAWGGRFGDGNHFSLEHNGVK